MKKICFLFPGQGSQKVGMGKEIAGISQSTKRVFDCASSIFNYSILNICEDEKKLQQTKFAQPAIVATSLSSFIAIKELGVLADCLVGHSLGQYCTLYAADVLSLEETFSLLKTRIDSIEKFPQKENVLMCAIIGVDPKTIEEECEKASGYVSCANFNLPNQTVISGEKEAVLEVSKKLEKIARRCVILNVSCAFHCNLMKDAAEEFSKKISNFNFKDAKTPTYSNVTAKKVQKAEEIKELLVQHFTKPVLFTTILSNIEKEDISVFIELGEGTTLSSFVKKTLKNVDTLNVKDKTSFLETSNFLNKLTSVVK